MKSHKQVIAELIEIGENLLEEYKKKYGVSANLFNYLNYLEPLPYCLDFTHEEIQTLIYVRERIMLVVYTEDSYIANRHLENTKKVLKIN